MQQQQQQVQQQQQHTEQYTLYGHSQEQYHPSHTFTAQSALLVGSQCSGLGAEIECWIADSGATTHTASNPKSWYNLRPPSLENAKVYIEDGTELQVRYVGSFDLIFHSAQDVPVTIECFLSARFEGKLAVPPRYSGQAVRHPRWGRRPLDGWSPDFSEG